MEYHDLVLSGKNTSLSISSGDLAYNTLVRNGAKLRISAGGYVESTTVLNSTTVSNAGSAVSTFLSGGTMVLSNGAVANTVSVLRNARLTVSAGARATDLYVSSGNVNATVTGGDETTFVSGVNEKGDFFLSNGVASNFLMNSLGQLTVSKGGSAMDVTIRFGGYLTVMSGGVATGIEQSAGGYVRADVYGADPNTVVRGVNASGEFSLSGGVASNFILYDGGAQQVFAGGTALHTLVNGQRAFQYVWSGGVASGTTVFKNGIANIYEGGIARDTMIYSGGSMVTNDGAIVSGATVLGTLQIDSGTGGEGESGGIARVGDVTVLSGGTLSVARKANFFGAIDIFGELKIAAGITVNALSVSSGGSARVSGAFELAAGSSWNTRVEKTGRVYIASGATLFNLATVSGARIDFAPGAVLAGTNFDIAENTICCGAAVLGMTASGGVINGLGADGKAYDLTFGSGVTVAGAAVGSGGRIHALSGAFVSGARISGGTVELLDAGARLEDTVIACGGSLSLVSGANTGRRLFFDFSGSPSGGSIAGTVNDFSLIGSATALCLVGTSDGGVYTIAPEGSSELYVHCMPGGLYENAIKAGETITNAFTSMTYAFDATGKSIAVTEFTAATQETAGSIAGGTTINGNGRAAKWTADTTTGGSGSIIKAATSAIAGDAWLELDGANLADTTLFGAEAGFTGAVNLYATNAAVLGNLAAGATSSGTVAGVKLTLEDATVGLAYAGGFGNVASKTETFISGATVLKDFYAGALANYAKTGHVTNAGDIALEITAGEFWGNIYGAASVKAGAATSLVHSVGDVTITVKGGETQKGNQACLFAGGYATGSTTNKVYTVGSVSTTIEGGDWGTVAGGRGVFGGIFASNVTAEAGAVSVTIQDGTFGNIYGGGWSQKNGASIVGNVDITIAGGTIANVFGGGTHSTSGGSTVVGDVTITVSGGNITGNIYAGGQQTGDTVAGDEISVTFTGDTNFACGVYGYSYDGGATGDAELYFTAYTGEFSGALGGFATITLDDDTAMTLATAAADVVNGAWKFDLTGRADALADTSLLTWSYSDFAGDTVRVNFTDATQAASEWSIATAAFDATTTFTLAINDTDVTTVAYNTAITDGDWAGWKFTDENGTLKFKNLAS